ncbi:MAG: nucleotidyltransferase domain-containing protein [bacterium]|nr:nucleotidyltransferase domain-containing protein [bacterium]MDZ4285057.1 nucleotidyltransferase domain-containing protein [Patescibacteria group bacterium]
MDQKSVDKKIKTIVDTIVRTFKPEKVILFGSYAWGVPTEDSDVDLLVVGESAKPRRERERDIDRSLVPRTMPLDILAYTPKELREKIDDDRNLFLEDIVSNGTVLYADD